MDNQDATQQPGKDHHGWIETKRDCDVDESGHLIVKKVTLEPARKKLDRKDKFDLFFRSIGLLAIGIPILLVFLQQKASLKSQRAIQQLDVYANTSMELNSVLRRPVTSSEFQKSKDRLLFELTPKLAFLFGEEISGEVEKISRELIMYTYIFLTAQAADSLYRQAQYVGSFLGSYRNCPPGPIDGEEDIKHRLQIMDSLSDEMADLNIKLNPTPAIVVVDDSISTFIKNMRDLNTQYMPFHKSFISNCMVTFDLLQKKTPPASQEYKTEFDSLVKKKARLLQLKPQLFDAFKNVPERFCKYLATQSTELQVAMRKSNKLISE